MRSQQSNKDAEIFARLMADFSDGVPPFASDLDRLDEILERGTDLPQDIESLAIEYAQREGNLPRIRQILLTWQSRGEELSIDAKAMLALASVLIDRDPVSAMQLLEATDVRQRENNYSYVRTLAVLEYLRSNTGLALDAARRARSLLTSPDDDEEKILNAIESHSELPSSLFTPERRKRFLAQRFPPQAYRF